MSKKYYPYFYLLLLALLWLAGEWKCGDEDFHRDRIPYDTLHPFLATRKSFQRKIARRFNHFVSYATPTVAPHKLWSGDFLLMVHYILLSYGFALPDRVTAEHTPNFQKTHSGYHTKFQVRSYTKRR